MKVTLDIFELSNTARKNGHVRNLSKLLCVKIGILEVSNGINVAICVMIYSAVLVTSATCPCAQKNANQGNLSEKVLINYKS